MITLRTLHDATFKGFKIDWKTGEIQFDFSINRQGKTVARITAKNFTNIECPRQYPWGPSVSVNGITEEKSENGDVLVIEMQSGDYIKTKATNFLLETD